MAEGTIKTQLVALLKVGAEEQHAFIVGLNEAQRAQVGMSDRWSAKDNLTHIAFWQKYRVQEYQMLEHGETPPKLPGDDVQNDIIFRAHRDQPWPEVIADAEAASAGLLALLEGYSDTDLTTPDHYPPPRNVALWHGFLSTGYAHPVFHYADFYVEHGDMAKATALQQRLATGTANLGDADARGVADYNLACFYA